MTASMAPEVAKIEVRHWLDADGTVHLRVSTLVQCELRPIQPTIPTARGID